jgi:putative spermidine/putrescine transport system substrate-binding protein
MKNIIMIIGLSISSLVISKDLKEVRFALWSGSSNINNWIDNIVAKDLKDNYLIKLTRVPLTDTEIAIKKLIRDKKVNRTKGNIDLLWVNGENFKVMQDKKLTWKSYLSELSNSKYLNPKDKSLFFDFGVKHDGHESPWGSAQMVMIYNSSKIKTPPKTIEGFKKWIVANPGRFTYSSPPDFTGSAFVRLMFLQLLTDEQYSKLLKSFDAKLFNKEASKLWNFLNEIKPSLYRKGQNYPQSISKLHQLYSDEVLWMTFDYYPTTAQRMIDKGVFPKATKTFVFDKGMLANTHYVSIPFNSPNKEAAKLVANYLLSTKAQISKMNPKNWGDLTVLDLKSLSAKDRKSFLGLDLGAATLPLQELSSKKRAELSSEYVPLFEKDWKKNVLTK